MTTTFNRNRKIEGNAISEPDQLVIEGSLNLRQASLADAARYGGPIMREALDALDLVGDRRYVVIDTKVNFLMPGFIPAIPGWHTDGVPRTTHQKDVFDPTGSGEPHLGAQEEELLTAPRYHLLVTGTHAPTRFIDEPMVLDLPTNRPYRNLYRDMTRLVNQRVETGRTKTKDAPSCTWLRWDWWDIHEATPAVGRGWRYLIRVTESDHVAPRVGASEFVRSQSQVYIDKEFGW